MKYKPEISLLYSATENILHAYVYQNGVFLKPEDAIGRTFYILKHYGTKSDKVYIDVSEKWGYSFNVLFKILNNDDEYDYYCKVVYMT